MHGNAGFVNDIRVRTKTLKLEYMIRIDTESLAILALFMEKFKNARLKKFGYYWYNCIECL
jgi:hypothetical protein